MTDLQVRDCVQVHVVGEATDLTALRPAPRRNADLVAARASALGLKPHRRPARYPIWPFLIVAGVVISYVMFAVVTR